MNARGDGGSTLPLILGFFIVAALTVAGTIAAGDSFVQERDLQDLCDGIALSVAATAVQVGRGGGADAGTTALTFDSRGAIDAAIEAYLSRDPQRRRAEVHALLSSDRRTVTISCAETEPVTFGGLFGMGVGVHHSAVASARAPTG